MAKDLTRAEKIERVRSLMAMAKGRANEAEAMAALGKAQKLASDYGLSQSDIEKNGAAAHDFVKSDPMFSGLRGAGDDAFTMCDMTLWDAVAKFCYVKVGQNLSVDGKDNQFIYFGYSIDVEIAKALRFTINGAMNDEWMVYRDLFSKHIRTEANDAKAKWSFGQEMGRRIRQRMQEIRQWEREEEKASGLSTSLVVSKEGLLALRAKEAGFKEIVPGYGKARAHDYSAAMAGRDAGNRVKLQTSVSANRGVMGITKQ